MERDLPKQLGTFVTDVLTTLRHHAKYKHHRCHNPEGSTCFRKSGSYDVRAKEKRPKPLVGTTEAHATNCGRCELGGGRDVDENGFQIFSASVGSLHIVF